MHGIPRWKRTRSIERKLLHQQRAAGRRPVSLTATYSGDINFAGSSSLPQDFSVVQVTSQMQLFPVPGYAFYGAENGNFFITGVGGGNGGNPTGFFSVTADGVNLVAPDSCSAGNGGGNPCLSTQPRRSRPPRRPTR